MTTPNPSLPGGEFVSPLLVRTAFDDDAGWSALLDTVAAPSPEGFLTSVEIVDDPAYRGLSPDRLQALLPAGEYVTFFFVADEPAISDPEHPLLAVPVPHPDSPFLDEPPRQPFRVVAASLWAVENNLSLANMDWRDFADNTDRGVFRGF